MNLSLADQLGSRDSRTHSCGPVNDCVSLTAKFLELSKRNAELRAERTQQESRLQDLRDNSADVCGGADLNSLNKDLVELYQRKEALSEEIAALTKEILGTRQDKEKMETEYRESEAEKQKHAQLFEELTEKKKDMDIKYGRIQEELAAMTQRFVEQTTKMEDLKTTVTSYEAGIKQSLTYIRENEKFATHRTLKNLITTKDAHTKGILGIGFGREYNSIITIGDDKKLCQWGLPALNEIASLPLQAVPNAFATNYKLGTTAVAGDDGTLRILNMETGRIQTTSKNHTAAATDVLWISDMQLVTSSSDRTLKLFDVNRNTVVKTTGVYMTVSSLCKTVQDNVLAAGCIGHVIVYDMRTDKPVIKIENVHRRQVTCVVPSTSRDTVFSMGLDGKVCESDIRKGGVIRKWESPELVVKYPLARFAVDPFGGFCAAGSENGSVVMFDLENDKKDPVILKGHNAPVLCSAFSANMLVTGDKEHKLIFWG